ncbi:MAG: LysR family transcriptional regulator [Betaproteobacteria bacterium]|nr:MAG: LysR family transcriptional regulator [Betaproteobacteria bacterium]
MQLAGLQFNQLRLVDALARSGNLSEAAAQIGVTQPAASHALARLRRQVEDPIFVRTSDGMRPTPYGSRLASSVREALVTLRSGFDRALFEPATSKRTFNVFMTGVGQMLFLPRLLERLSLDAPGVTLRVRHVPAKAPHLMLESGEVDLAIGAFTTLIAGCRQKRLFRERYVCVVRHDHPAFKDGMNVEAFHRVPHALAEPTGYVEDLLDRWLSRQKVRRIVKLHVPYFLALPHLIARSDLLAFMSNRVAEAYAEILPLKVMQPPTKLPTYDSKLFWHERFHRDPANRWLRELFVDLFSE